MWGAGFGETEVTEEAALANIKEAIRAYVGALEADSLPVPEDRFEARLVTM